MLKKPNHCDVKVKVFNVTPAEKMNAVCPNKHGNSVTILNLSTSAWIGSTQPLITFILQPSWAEVDDLNIVTEFPCFLGLTVCAAAGLSLKSLH